MFVLPIPRTHAYLDLLLEISRLNVFTVYKPVTCRKNANKLMLLGCCELIIIKIYVTSAMW